MRIYGDQNLINIFLINLKMFFIALAVTARMFNKLSLAALAKQHTANELKKLLSNVRRFCRI